MKYTDLHIHTKYTDGNGITEIPDLIKMAKEYKMDRLAIVDSASIKGFKEFKEECDKNLIKPIFGCGFYFNYGEDKIAHLVLLAKNREGLNHLVSLDRESRNSMINGKPTISFGSLEGRTRNLIALTGGLGGVFDKLYISGDKDRALNNIKRLKSLFNSNLYLELQDNGLPENREMRDIIMDLSEKESIRIVISGGSFYLNPDDSFKCNLLRRERGNRELKGHGYNFKSSKDIERVYPKHIIELDCSYKIGILCNY